MFLIFQWVTIYDYNPDFNKVERGYTGFTLLKLHLMSIATIVWIFSMHQTQLIDAYMLYEYGLTLISS